MRNLESPLHNPRHGLDRAREIESLAERDPTCVAPAARSLLAEDDIAELTAAICQRVLALVEVRAGRLDRAEAHIEQAIVSAEQAGDDATIGTVHLTAMSVAASTGKLDQALAHADIAQPLLPAEQQSRLAVQRGSVLMAANRTLEAYEAFEEVRKRYLDIDDRVGASLYMNLGTTLVRLNRLAEGTARLTRARDLFEALGDRDHATACAVHAAVAAARGGDHATVFAIHREVAAEWDQSIFAPRTHGDLADCLAAAGLFDEAEARIRAAIALLGDSLSEVSVRTELSLTRLLRRTGDPAAAEAAEQTRLHADALNDEVLAALATIELAAIPTAQVDDAALAHAISRCREAGLADEAIDGEIVAMERWLRKRRRERDREREHEHGREHGRGSARAPDFTSVPITGSLLQRAQAHHHRALAALCHDEPGAARTAIARGLRAIDRSRAAIGADELRAVAADRAPAMAQLGLRAAWSTGRPSIVFEWAERARAASLRLSQPASSIDQARRRDLDALRSLAAGSPAAQQIEQRVVEQRRADTASGNVATSTPAAALRRSLTADQVLLEFVEIDAKLVVIEVRSTRTTMHELDIDPAAMAHDIGKLLFGLRRMATQPPGAPAASSPLSPAAAMVNTLAARFDQALLGDRVREHHVVIVPTGVLHQLPWAALPTLADRAIVVAPSAHIWHRACQTPNARLGSATQHPSTDDRHGRVLVATGPGLPLAEDEALAIAATWRCDPMLLASSIELADRFTAADIVHVCCHGRFRADNPQFSAVDLADGPFMVVDLDGAPRLPATVVLSACNVGAVDVKVGDDVLGFPAAMLARGVRSLIAASLPIEDAAARSLAVELHHHLADGAAPAEALRRARRAVRERSPIHAAAAAALACYGAG